MIYFEIKNASQRIKINALENIEAAFSQSNATSKKAIQSLNEKLSFNSRAVKNLTNQNQLLKKELENSENKEKKFEILNLMF